MKSTLKTIAIASLLTAVTLTPFSAFAHGDVVPHSVDATALPQLGDKWRAENPYRDNKAAAKLGESAYGANCARCHGLQAMSGGIAPDLRLLDRDCVGMKNEKKKLACYKETDNYFLTSIRHGKVRNGAVYMPPFEGILSQEAMWAVKAYLETVRQGN
ncbi:MAG: cytochrome c-550 PedF [Glaciimonas sp.]|nr:cytochrome c-550 PedF [Glaciimonas sp.]